MGTADNAQPTRPQPSELESALHQPSHRQRPVIRASPHDARQLAFAALRALGPRDEAMAHEPTSIAAILHACAFAILPGRRRRARSESRCCASSFQNECA